MIYHSNAFQYIPCWYLSKLNNLKIKLLQSFNTSHVGIYLFLSLYHLWQIIEFQYIPCWYLSLFCNKFSPFSQVFQYIPCWYLSVAECEVTYSLDSFNTSHVGIYRRVLKWWRGAYISFNTSHVGIYPTSLKHFHFCLSSFTLVLYTISLFFTSLFEIFLIFSKKCFKPLFYLSFKPFPHFYGW